MSLPPTSLGPYEIIREIARSNDIVYEAFDSGTNRRVAVKQLSIPLGATDPQAQDRIARFQREAKAVGSLNHPNIMTVYSFAEDEGRWYLAMEFLDGVTLRKEIDTKGTIDPERAVEIAVETLSGLGHAHANGVIHRDIKPDNIQIVSSGQVKITDFGIARLTFDRNITIDGQVFGTPSYMSPEQVVGREIDQRSDIFSVGVMLYEMLTGTKPFAGDSVVTITYNIVNTTIAPVPSIPNELWSVIARAIDKVPANRYASAEEMISELRRAVAAMHAPPPPATPWAVNPPVSFNPAAIQGSAYGTSPGTMAPPPVLGAPPGVGQFPPPNPYAGGIGYGNLPNMTGLPGGGFVPPMYYPPPPRQPLMKPEMRDALVRFVGFFITIGLLFLVIGYAFKVVVDGATGGGARHFQTSEGSLPSAGLPEAADGNSNAVSPRTSVSASAPEQSPLPEADVPSNAELQALQRDCITDPTGCAAFNGKLSLAEANSGPARKSEFIALRRDAVVALIALAHRDPSRTRDALLSASDLSRTDGRLSSDVEAARDELDPNLTL